MLYVFLVSIAVLPPLDRGRDSTGNQKHEMQSLIPAVQEEKDGTRQALSKEDESLGEWSQRAALKARKEEEEDWK